MTWGPCLSSSFGSSPTTHRPFSQHLTLGCSWRTLAHLKKEGRKEGRKEEKKERKKETLLLVMPLWFLNCVYFFQLHLIWRSKLVGKMHPNPRIESTKIRKLAVWNHYFTALRVVEKLLYSTLKYSSKQDLEWIRCNGCGLKAADSWMFQNVLDGRMWGNGPIQILCPGPGPWSGEAEPSGPPASTSGL